MNYHFRKATLPDINPIWQILQEGILRRKKDGSDQWQDGYPNKEVVQNDIQKGVGYVLMDGETIIGYTAIIINDEPEYTRLEGKWLSENDFVVCHRVVVAEKYAGRGLGKKIIEFIEEFALQNQIDSIKADTNFDNIAMTRIFEATGFTLCGIVHFRGNPRNAYEKLLPKQNFANRQLFNQ